MPQELPPRAPRSVIANGTALFSSLERNAPVGAMRSRRRAPSRRDRPLMERSARNADNVIQKEHSKASRAHDGRRFFVPIPESVAIGDPQCNLLGKRRKE